MEVPLASQNSLGISSIDLRHRSACDVYGWGRNDMCQAGTEGDEAISAPALLSALQGKVLACVTGNLFHSAFVTVDGDLYLCGGNDSGQLAKPDLDAYSPPVRAQAMDAHAVAHAACGQGFTLVVTRAGRVYAWGAGEFGQLGGGAAVVTQHHPKPVARLQDLRVERLAAGSAHALALSACGRVFSWGMGVHGALGHGDEDNRESPARVERLWAAGIVAIAAGDDHSAALGADGAVYTWGRGKYGALGHGDTATATRPRVVAALRGTPVVQLAAGANHCAALSQRGRLYTWGHNRWGQCGLGSTDDATLPVVVQESESWDIVEISAGARQTVALCADSTVRACGSWELSQPGDARPAVTTFQPLPLSFSGPAAVRLGAKRSSASLNSHPLDIGPPHAAGREPHSASRSDGAADGGAAAPPRPGTLVGVYACGEHMFAVLRRGEAAAAAAVAPAPAAPATLQPSARMALPDVLRLARAAAAAPEAAKASSVAQLVAAVAIVFGSPGFLIAAFSSPAPAAAARQETGVPHALDLNAIAQVFEAVLTVYESSVVEAMTKAVLNMLNELVDRLDPSDSESSTLGQAQWLKVLLIMLLNPTNSDTRSGRQTIPAVLSIIVMELKPKLQKILVDWIASLPADVLGGRIIRPLQRHITAYVQAFGFTDTTKPHIILIGSLLRFIQQANLKAGMPVPYTKLHNAALSRALTPHLHQEYIMWIHSIRSGSAHGKVLDSVLQLPFLLDSECKKNIMRGEASLQQNHEVRSSLERGIELQGLPFLIGPQVAQLGFLDIIVRRGRVVESAMAQLQARAHELKKPLRVTFVGESGVKEEGLDEGGVSKEFFQLLVRELFSVEFGMFEYNEETREFWFNAAAMQLGVTGLDFHLVGIVLGLAIFNGVILDVHFPLVVYKKLLGGSPDFADLLDANPSLAKGLQSLLDYSGDDVEDVFCRTFEIEYTVLGAVQTVELVPGGSNKPVTNANRREFVDLVVDWHLNKSIAEAFRPFKEGFQSVTSGYALHLFDYHELELLVCGLPHLDFEALEKASKYDGGYGPQHPLIAAFWKVIHGMSLEQKKKFLFFVTGCDRAPMGGLGKLPMLIQRAGPDSDRLPTSHTCFNVLLLPEYSSESKLRERLTTAVNNAEGFGLQ